MCCAVIGGKGSVVCGLASAISVAVTRLVAAALGDELYL